MPENMLLMRADYAYDAASRHADKLDGTELNFRHESYPEKLSDLLASLRCLCDRDGLDFAKIDKRAYEIYISEIGIERSLERARARVSKKPR
jgi:hypothetical protein